MAIKTQLRRLALLSGLFVQLQRTSALPSGNTEASSDRSMLEENKESEAVSPLAVRQVLDNLTMTQVQETSPVTLNTSTSQAPIRIIHVIEQELDDKDKEEKAKEEVNFDCGFTLNDTTYPSFALFTEALETDWVHVSSIEEETD